MSEEHEEDRSNWSVQQWIDYAIAGNKDLEGANLEGADLPEDVTLAGANLRGANFRGAWLDGTDFYEADLRGADLRGAIFDEVCFWRADLTGAHLDLRDLDWRVLTERQKSSLAMGRTAEARYWILKQSNEERNMEIELEDDENDNISMSVVAGKFALYFMKRENIPTWKAITFSENYEVRGVTFKMEGHIRMWEREFPELLDPYWAEITIYHRNNLIGDFIVSNNYYEWRHNQALTFEESCQNYVRPIYGVSYHRENIPEGFF